MNTTPLSELSGIALDIDDTLSWTCREWVSILFKEFGNPENLTSHEFAKKYRLLENAPYFQRADVLARCLEICVDESNYHSIRPIEEAGLAIQGLEHIVLIAAYLTARPESLRRATGEWLKKYGFPEAELIMNPHEFSIEKKGSWKQDALIKLYPRIAGIIDDNPSVCDNLPADYPGVVFLYEYGEGSAPHPRAIACGDWSDVVEKVTRHFAPQELYGKSYD
jgi:hypothetical protein